MDILFLSIMFVFFIFYIDSIFNYGFLNKKTLACLFIICCSFSGIFYLQLQDCELVNSEQYISNKLTINYKVIKFNDEMNIVKNTYKLPYCLLSEKTEYIISKNKGK